MAVMMVTCAAAQRLTIAAAPSPAGVVSTDGSDNGVGNAVNVTLFVPQAPPNELVGSWFGSSFATDGNGTCYELCQTALFAPDSNVVLETSAAPCELLISPRVFESFYGYEANLILNLTALQYIYNTSCVGAGEGYAYLQTWSLTPSYSCIYYRYDFDAAALYAVQGAEVKSASNVTNSCPPPVGTAADLQNDGVAGFFIFNSIEGLDPLSEDNATCSSGLNTAPIADVTAAFEQAYNATLTNICYNS